MKIIITGGTGFIGRALVERVSSQKHEITVLTRGTSTSGGSSPNVKFERWDGAASGAWTKHLDGADAVINLAGEIIAGKRWSARQKEILRNSRLNTTRSIVAAIQRAAKKPSVFISASGVGYYGNVESGDVTESSAKGSGFLSDLCAEWEAEAMNAEKAGVRVVTLRTGVVLGNDGGALKKMLLPFKLFAGGPLGSGKQWFPWIHLEDEIGLIAFALERRNISGPINCVAPEPATMSQFCKSLGHAMHRPSWAPVPGFALKLVLGEMAEVILTGQRAVPKKALEAGYAFRYPALERALSAICGS